MILVTAAMAGELQGLMPPGVEVGEGLISLAEDLFVYCLGTGKVHSALSIQECLHACAPEAVLHLGICGGADPALSVGDMVIPHWASDADSFLNPSLGSREPVPMRSALSHPWGARLARVVSDAAGGRPRESCGIASGDRFFTPHDKARLFGSSAWNGIAAVDMESFSVAYVCERRHVPLVIVKIVSDDSEDRRPKGFSRFMRTQAQRLAAVVHACRRLAR